MITTATNTSCLTFGQLRDYSFNKGSREERALQYLHISQCELCACAVNGFTAMPFTIAEVNAIHHQVDVRANAAHANPLIFARVLFAALCAASIFGFYYFADSFSQTDKKTDVVKPAVEEIIAPVVPAVIPPVKEPEKIETTITKSSAAVPVPPSEIPVEEITPLPGSLNSCVSAADEKLAPWHADVIYIYDLKVTDYNKLYFNFAKNNFEIKGHVPSYRENDSTADYLADDHMESIAVDKVLKTGLSFFVKENYPKALEQFVLLRENNPDDENALFYGGVCCSNLGKNKAAIRCFEEILKDPHSPFYEEAKWNLGLSRLTIGEKGKALEIFSAIVKENGFYSKKAAEKLRSL
ncbi:MAG: tetratricopeptide repeat protein [Bacteroidia bacterium]